MKFRYLSILCFIFVFGCSKPAPTGNVASNSTDVKSPTDATTGSSTGASSGSTGTVTPGDPKSTTKPPATGPKAAPNAGPKEGPKASVPTQPGAGTPPPGTSSKPTPPPQTGPTAEQQKAMAANGAKADKAVKATLGGVSGTYKAVIDDSKVPAQFKSQPGYAEKLAQAKANPPSIVVGKDGSLSIKGLFPMEVTGFTSKIDGKPAIVLNIPKPRPGMPTKTYVPITITQSGSTLTVGQGTFKRS
ncbi:MAG: hypothetical protein ACYC96_16050 [Fimbriimonadaceae bacterium]